MTGGHPGLIALAPFGAESSGGGSKAKCLPVDRATEVFSAVCKDLDEQPIRVRCALGQAVAEALVNNHQALSENLAIFRREIQELSTLPSDESLRLLLA